MDVLDTTTQQILQTVAELGAVNALRAAGVSNAEISARQAYATFGRWFKDQEAAGQILPRRVGAGRNGKRYYAVEDILKLRAAQMIRAELQLQQTRNTSH